MGSPGKGFVMNEDKCLKSLKKLRKEIALDEEEERNDTLLLLGGLRVVEDMLIPLAVRYGANDEKLLKEICKLAVQLSMPVKEWEKKKDARLGHLRSQKSAFIKTGNMTAFTKLLDGHLSGKEDKLLVELVLWLIRNLLAVPDAKLTTSSASGGSHMAYLHDDFLSMLDREVISDVLLFLGEYVGTEGNREWNLILLEIYYHIFRTTSPQDLVRSPLVVHEKSTSASSSKAYKTKSDDRLLQALTSSRQKRIHAQRQASSRHSRFGGLLSIKNGENRTRIVHNAFELVSGSKDLLETNKARAPRRKKKSEQGEENEEKPQKTTSEGVRKMLRKVCDEFIGKCYDPLFKALKTDFRREDVRLLPSDREQFLWLAKFCMAYELQKHQNDQQFAWWKSAIMVTMDIWTFSYVIKTMQLMESERNWRGLAIAVETLDEMMTTLLAMKRSNLVENQKLCQSLQNAVFYENTELDIVIGLVRTWDGNRLKIKSLHHLASILDAMIEITAELSAQGAMVAVASKRKRRRKVKTNKQVPWTVEEMMALVEASKMFQVGLFTKALKDPSLAPIFHDSREPKHLAAQWKQFQESKMDVERFIASQQEEHDDDEEEMTRQQEKQLEKQLSLDPLVRAITTNKVVKHVCTLIDPCVSQPNKRSYAIVNGLLQRIHMTCPPMLWHVSLFSIYYRNLASVPKPHPCPELLETIADIMEAFFTNGKENQLVYVEALFWRTKQDSAFIQRLYVTPEEERYQRSKQDERLFEARKEQEHHQSDDEDDEMDWNSKSFRQRIPKKRRDKRSNIISPDRLETIPGFSTVLYDIETMYLR